MKGEEVTKKKALIVYGGWAGHEPKQCAEIFEPWLKEDGFAVTVSDSLDILCNKRKMRKLDVIIPLWTMGEISAEQWVGMKDSIMHGAGVAGWHGGMCDSFRANTDYQFMTGGQWVAHPGNIIRYKVKIVDKKDPLMKGLSDFWVTSEQYYMHTDPGNKVLASTTFSGRHGDTPWIKGTEMPVVWTRRYGKSRIFYSSLGHVAEEFEKYDKVFEIMKRGIRWAAGKK